MVVQRGIVAAAEAGNVTVGVGPQVSAQSRISVSGGNVFANIHGEAACRVEASSTWGRVESNLPLAIQAGASGKRKLSGDLNGGGPIIALHASDGSVKLGPGVVLLGEH